MQVRCIRIPADGSPIQRIAVGITMSDQGPFSPSPVLRSWWMDNDPTKQLQVWTPEIILFP